MDIFQFTDVARQLETFFLQKRFTIYNHKPEMILKEDTGELKAELVGRRIVTKWGWRVQHCVLFRVVRTS